MKKIIPFKKDIIFKTNLAEITSISLDNTLDFEKYNEINGKFIVSGEYKIADTSTNVESFSYDLPFHISMDEKYILDNAKIDIDDFYYEVINSNILSINIEVLIDNLGEKQIIKEIEEVRETLKEVKDENQNEIIQNNTTIDEVRNDIANINKEQEDIKINILEEKNIDIEDINVKEIHIEKDDKEEIIMNDNKDEFEIDMKRCIEEEIESEEKSRNIKQEQTVEGISSLFDNMNSTSETYKSYKIYIVRDGDNLETIIEKYSTTKEILEEYNDLKEIKIGDKIIIPS